MTVEFIPLGMACNLNCAYCYQGETRKMLPHAKDIDWAAAMEAARRVNKGAKQPGVSLFGGEALLLDKENLKRFFEEASKIGSTGMQTNGTLIDDEHIALFKKYCAGIGISIDGPEELNDLRCAHGGNLGKTREMTAKTIANIGRLVDAGVIPSIIVTMHAVNCGRPVWSRFLSFVNGLADRGVRHINFHFMQANAGCGSYVLSEDDETDAFLALAGLQDADPDRRCWQPFTDMKNLIRGKSDNALCVWRDCDPLTTSAVQGIEADGSLSNCGRQMDGVNWLKAATVGNERSESLRQADQEFGGCSGCRFWTVCYGGCPGEAIDGDWRNRTTHCATIKALYRRYEEQMLDAGETPAYLSAKKSSPPQWGQGHGDCPHGDQHGDHTDAGGAR
jgi:uncharacterized protein